MNIRIRYFASLREIVGQSEEQLTIKEGERVSDIRARLNSLYPRLEPILVRSVCAVNHAYVPAETALHDGDELVFIPPMGGGALRADNQDNQDNQENQQERENVWSH